MTMKAVMEACQQQVDLSSVAGIKDKAERQKVSQDLLSPEWAARVPSFGIVNQFYWLNGRNHFSLGFLFREYVYEQAYMVEEDHLGRKVSLRVYFLGCRTM